MCETSGMTDGKVRRRPLAIALVALASLLAYLAIVAIWVDRQTLNTDNWTQASSQMLEDPTVRNRVAECMVEQLYANVDVEAEIREALPERAQPLAGPVAGAVRNFVERAANEVLSRPRAQRRGRTPTGPRTSFWSGPSRAVARSSRRPAASSCSISSS